MRDQDPTTEMVETMPAPRPAGWRKMFLRPAVVLLIVAVAAVIIFEGPGVTQVWDTIQANLDTWRGLTDRHLLAALAAYFILYAAATSLPLPVVTCASLLAGALFGRWLGTLVASLAYTLGVTVSFLVVRSLLRDHVRRRFGRRLRRVERGVRRDGSFYLLTLRLMPSIPYYLINWIMAVTSMRLGTYVVVSWVGMLPLTFLAAGVGTELADLKSPADVFSVRVVVSLVVLAVFPLLARAGMRRLNLTRHPEARASAGGSGQRDIQA